MRVSIKSSLIIISLIVMIGCSGGGFRLISNNNIADFLQNHPYLNAAFMINQDDQVIIKNSQGFFDKKKGISLKPNQVMPIASLTKQFTAAMVMRLQERGELNVHDSVAKLLPASSKIWPNNLIPDWAKTVTIHQLLTHTSGIAEYIPAIKFDASDSFDIVKMKVIEYASNAPLAGEPGSSYSYNNTGYFLLGIIIEYMTKSNLIDVFNNEFFIPLEMNNTYLANLETAIKYQKGELSQFPKGYLAVPTGYEPKYLPAKVEFLLVPFADGGVLSCVEDLIKWSKALHNGEVLSETSYKFITTPHNAGHNRNLEKVDVGYGTYIYNLPDGQKVYFHSGRVTGIRSEMGYIPSSKLHFAILSNVMCYEPEELQGKIDYKIKENQFDIYYLLNEIFNSITSSTFKERNR